MRENSHTHIELLDRFMRGETSSEEEELLLAWFSNPDNKGEIVAYYEQKWVDTSGMKLSAEVQARMFQNIKKRMKPVERVRRGNAQSHTLRKWFSYAAVALICICLGMGSLLYLQQRQLPIPKEYVVLADNGQRASVILPDGTKVWLNSHTRLTYDTNYGTKERSVFLTGEAYFEVAKDKEHRFVVKAGGMEVEALGTSFNVRAYEEDDKMTTTLFEGSVRAMIGRKSVVLLPDQSAVFTKSDNKLSVNCPRNASYACLWRANELAFTGESLEDIAVILNRMYNVKIHFLSDQIKKYRFSGVIRNNSLDNVFEIISLTAPITYEAVDDTIYLRENKH